MHKVLHNTGIVKDTIGEQVIISTRSLTPLHQRMELNRSREVREKERPIWHGTPVNRAMEALDLHTR